VTTSTDEKKPESHDEKKPDESVTNSAEATIVPTAQDEIVYPTGLRLVAIIIALCLAVLLVALDQTIIATAIPRITDRFNSVSDIGWYGSVILSPPIGLSGAF
jgi:hypothetical protein